MKERFRTLWKKLINRETISYLVCGVLTTVLNYAVEVGLYYVLVHTSLIPAIDPANDALCVTIANTTAWLVAVIFAFLVNKIFVFQSKEWNGKRFWYEFGTFTAARILSGIFENIFMVVTVSNLHMANWLAKILANVVVVILNYIASKLVIFRKKE